MWELYHIFYCLKQPKHLLLVLKIPIFALEAFIVGVKEFNNLI